MRTIIYALLMMAASFSGCHQPKPVPLTFYIVSEAKIEGGRFINTADLPKVGYVGAFPDLVITRLEAVEPKTNSVGSVLVETNGQETVLPGREQPQLYIRFFPEDRKQFTALTEKALGKRVLLMRGDMPLTAPKVVTPIDTPGIMLDIGKEQDLKTLTEGLRKLVP